MKRTVTLIVMCLFVFCGVSLADDTNVILNEKVELVIEFQLSDRGESTDAKNICEETASMISEQRIGTYVSDLNYVVINTDKEYGTGKVSCSFELKRGESCNCNQMDCGDGTQVNGCKADCPDGYSANCDCGSCNGIQTSTCRCY